MSGCTCGWPFNDPSIVGAAKQAQAVRDASDIVCPACRYEFTTEDMEGHVTYWGDDPSKEDECPNCEAKLLIAECVVRTFDVELVEEGGEQADE